MSVRVYHKPAHVIWTAGDRHLPIHWAPRLVSKIPGCTGPTVIPHAAHFLQPEVPETLAREFLAFFGRPTNGAVRAARDGAAAAPGAKG